MNQLLFIAWGPDPQIVRLDVFGVQWPITWYSILFAASFLGGQRLLTYLYVRDGKSVTDAELLTLYGVVGTIVGARLGHYLFYEWELLIDEPGQWIKSMLSLPFRGLASHGATIALLLALYLYSRKRSDQAFLWVTDRAVIVGGFGGVLIRLGNLFNSEIYGQPTNLPWGFVFVRETDPAQLPLVPRHPTQLYEALFCLFLFGLSFYLWKHQRRQLPNGFITGLFLVLLFTFRFLIEFLKANQSRFEEDMVLNMGQLLSIPAIAIGFCILMISRKFASGWHRH